MLGLLSVHYKTGLRFVHLPTAVALIFGVAFGELISWFYFNLLIATRIIMQLRQFFPLYFCTSVSR